MELGEPDKMKMKGGLGWMTNEEKRACSPCNGNHFSYIHIIRYIAKLD